MDPALGGGQRCLRGDRRQLHGVGFEDLDPTRWRGQPDEDVPFVPLSRAWVYDLSKFLYAVDHGNADRLRSDLCDGYYTQTTPAVAEGLIRRWMKGRTAEWEETMIPDIIALRSGRRASIEHIGTYFESASNDGYESGVDRILVNVDGSEYARVRRALDD